MSLTARLQADLDHHMMKLLNVLQWLGGLKTKRELLNNALTLLRWAVKERMKGNVICSINERTFERKELEMPYLESVAGNALHAASDPRVIAVLGLTIMDGERQGAAQMNTESNDDGNTNSGTKGRTRAEKRGANTKQKAGMGVSASGSAALRG